jgi:hypothetical protein
MIFHRACFQLRLEIARSRTRVISVRDPMTGRGFFEHLAGAFI